MVPFYQDGGLISGFLHMALMACQAGLCIAIRQQLESNIMSTSTTMNKRAQFLILKRGS